MSSNVNKPAPTQEPDGPGAGPMSPWWIVTVAVYLVLVSGLVVYGLIKLWPYPTPSGERPTDQVASTQAPANQPNGNPQAQPGNGGGSTSAPASGNPQTPPANNGQATQTQTRKPLPDPEYIKFFGGRFAAAVFLETRLLLLVMMAGALGSLMHALRSLYWYTGNRKMIWSWVAFYILLPVTGGILATIFYFVIRGGFFSSTAQFETTSPFGFTALAALVGLFSPQATLKLKEIAETVFSKPAPGTDNQPQGSATSPKPAPTITSVGPNSGAANDSVVIAGTNFAQGVVVKFGGVNGIVSSVSDSSLTVVVPANSSATGPVDVQVTNSDGQSVTLSQGFTYVAGGATDAATADELDGHDEIKSNTTDEELPITEGGVE